MTYIDRTVKRLYSSLLSKALGYEKKVFNYLHFLYLSTVYFFRHLWHQRGYASYRSAWADRVGAAEARRGQPRLRLSNNNQVQKIKGKRGSRKIRKHSDYSVSSCNSMKKVVRRNCEISVDFTILKNYRTKDLISFIIS